MRGELGDKFQILVLVISVVFLFLVLEMVRRRKLVERYALLWMFAAVALLVLAIWRDLLEMAADAAGILSPVNALFAFAFGGSLILLLHFSVATSRLSEESKILAQEVARLDLELRAARAAQANGAVVEPAEEPARTQVPPG
jgi:hypothetical protein